jgi:hypothetical protein
MRIFYLIRKELSMNINQKIEEILLWCKLGVPRNKIDKKSKGNAVRALIKKSSSVSENKIHEMYENILPYKRGELQVKKIIKIELKTENNGSYEDKKRDIIKALSQGVPKHTIDKKGHGGACDRLLKGRFIREKKMNEMYNNLIEISKSDKAEEKQLFTVDQSEKKILSLTKQINVMVEENKTMKKEIEKLKKKSLKLKENRGHRVLGIAVMIKTDIIKGKKYKRWYGCYRKNRKQKWIYIGVEFSKAKEKIQNHFKKQREEANAS